MVSALRRRRRRRVAAGERGAVAVEAALITPILVLFLLGILEFAFIMRDYAATSSASRVGARIASANAGAGPADCDPTPCTPPSSPKLAQLAADAIEQAGTAMPKNSIDYIIVYQANKRGYPAPSGTSATAIQNTDTATSLPSGNASAACGAFANCVAYNWSDAKNKFVYAGGSWLSPTIDACASTAYSAGVYMHVTHQNVTSIFGKTIGLGDRAVMRFEPLSATECNSSATVPHK